MKLKQEISQIVYENHCGDLFDRKRVEGLTSHMHQFVAVAQIHLIHIERSELKMQDRDSWIVCLSIWLGDDLLIMAMHVYSYGNQWKVSI